MENKRKILHEKFRFAAIDIGSNSIHLIIATMDHAGHLRVLDTDKATVRLGQSLVAHGRLPAEAIRRAVDALKHMLQIVHAYHCPVRAVATHSVREAANYHEFHDIILQATGLKVEIIDGIEEARLAFLGMRYGLHLGDAVCLGVDIGGGSTEIIIARGDQTLFATSLRLGAVVLTERFHVGRPRSRGKIAEVYQEVAMALAPFHNQIAKYQFRRAIASSGTAKALANIDSRTMRARPNTDPSGMVVEAADLKKICKVLENIYSPKKIHDVLGIENDRADIILAGAIILRSITQFFKVKEWNISQFGLREGVVIDTYRRTIGYRLHHAPDIRSASVQSFATRLGIEMVYAEHVAKLALSLFDQLAKYYFKTYLRSSERHLLMQLREHLEVAALLHEAGKFLSITAYHRHSYYLIAHSRMHGFSQDEREFIGLIARFHRKSTPSVRMVECQELDKGDFAHLTILSAISRLVQYKKHRCKNRFRRFR